MGELMKMTEYELTCLITLMTVNSMCEDCVLQNVILKSAKMLYYKEDVMR